MSVRHINAKPGEYIAVHRRRRRAAAAAPQSTNEELFTFLITLGIGIAIFLVIMFWKIVVMCIIATVAIFLIWIFRTPLWITICWLTTQLFKLLCWGKNQICRVITAAWMKLKNCTSQKNSQTPAINATVSTEYSRASADYGKIIQNRR